MRIGEYGKLFGGEGEGGGRGGGRVKGGGKESIDYRLHMVAM